MFMTILNMFLCQYTPNPLLPAKRLTKLNECVMMVETNQWTIKIARVTAIVLSESLLLLDHTCVVDVVVPGLFIHRISLWGWEVWVCICFKLPGHMGRGFKFCLHKAHVCWVSACFQTPRFSLFQPGSFKWSALFYVPLGRRGATVVSNTPISTPAHSWARNRTQVVGMGGRHVNHYTTDLLFKHIDLSFLFW